jgi:hypothetical protein
MTVWLLLATLPAFGITSVIDPVLVYATYLGGSASDIGYVIAVGGGGYAYVTGYITSPNFPTTPGALDTVYAGAGYSDIFVTKFAPSGSSLSYSTYLGGDIGDEEGRSIFLDGAGGVYVGGLTASTTFPATPGAFDTSYNGGSYDGFLFKLQFP